VSCVGEESGVPKREVPTVSTPAAVFHSTTRLNGRDAAVAVATHEVT
jgi:hypothetical protein